MSYAIIFFIVCDRALILFVFRVHWMIIRGLFAGCSGTCTGGKFERLDLTSSSGGGENESSSRFRGCFFVEFDGAVLGSDRLNLDRFE